MFLILAGAHSAVSVLAQNIHITKYIPSNFLESNLHRVEIHNGGNSPVDLSGYVLITWDYSFIFPSGTALPSNQTVTLSRMGTKASNSIAFNRHPNFSLRNTSRINGAYCCIYNRQYQFLEGFYISPTDETPFLPDSVSTVYENNKPKTINIRIPATNQPGWSGLTDDRNRRIKIYNDPIIGYEKMSGKWQIVSAKGITLNPSAKFEDFQARFRDNHVVLKWKTLFEDHLNQTEIQRSKEGINFETIDIKKSEYTKSNTITEYSIFDTNVEKNQTYFYRLKRLEKDGQYGYSEVITLIAKEPTIEFWIEPFPTKAQEGEAISIRFFSAYEERVFIKLFTEKFKEIDVLFDGFINAGHQNLLKINARLPKGVYYIYAIVHEKRYLKEFLIQ